VEALAWDAERDPHGGGCFAGTGGGGGFRYRDVDAMWWIGGKIGGLTFRSGDR